MGVSPDWIERSTLDPTHRRLPDVAGYAVAALLGLVGTASVLGGIALVDALDPAAAESFLRRAGVHSALLSPAELAAVGATVTYWSGVGALLAGGLLVAGGGVAFLDRFRSADGGGTGHAATTALYGAAVSVALAFVPGSPVLGGATAGYLQNDRGLGPAVGAASGVVASVPVLLLLGFAFLGATNGLAAAGATVVAALVALLGVLTLSLVVAFASALGAVGGALGERIDRSPV